MVRARVARVAGPLLGVVVGTLAVCGAYPAAAASPAAPSVTTDDWQTLEDLGRPAPTADQLERSVREYASTLDSWLAVLPYSTEGAVKSLETTEKVDAGTVVTLTSDILFTPDSAEIAAPAQARIAELVVGIAAGTQVDIGGHTDSVDTPEHNLDLSTRRAQSVAAVIAAARPDLVLNAQGFGETQLKESESGENPGLARAANRRVELHYAG